MKLVVEVKNKKVIVNDEVYDLDVEKCFLIGRIYNMDEFASSLLSIEEKILNLYKENPKNLKKLHGEYIIVLFIRGKIVLIRDKMGSKNLYYAFFKKKFICTTELKHIIEKYRNHLEINQEALKSYLRYLYINAPQTIFKDVYKVREGEIVEIDDYKYPIIKRKKYYDIVKEYKKLKNKEKNYKKAKQNLEKKLTNAVEIRCKNCNKIGVYFSAGIDSTLVAALGKKLNKNIHTYTIGFYESEKNEASRAKKIAAYLKTNHHEFYLSKEEAKEIVKKSVQIYSEPFADSSIIPTIFLNQKVDKNVDIVLTGDGADQLFLGSNISIYHYSSLKSIFMKKHSIRTTLGLKYGRKDKLYKGYKDAEKFIDDASEFYFEPIKEKVNHFYMLMDILCFLSNRLMSKVSHPANYYNIPLAHPFNDDEVVKEAAMLKFSFKRRKGIKKYIIRDILNDYIPKNLLNDTKNGFGIPIENWTYEVFSESILKYSTPDILKKQGLFSVHKISIIMDKLQAKKLNRNECYVLFAYYIFQLWYSEYIKPLES